MIACYTRLADDLSPVIIHSGRFFAYVCPYFFVTWPLLYRCYVYCNSDGDLLEFSQQAIFNHALNFLFSFAAAFFYLSHIPERFSPGQFDIHGHSHQWFHLCTTAATYFQLAGVLEDYKAKKCIFNETFANQTHMWPCEHGSGFSNTEELVSSSFLSTSITGLVVHNLMACSLLAAIVVPRVVERDHHRHHAHHNKHRHGHRHHHKKSNDNITITEKETALSKQVFIFAKRFKDRVVRLGSFRYR